MKVPVDDGPGIVNYALIDWNGPENGLKMQLQDTWSCKALFSMLFYLGLGVLSGCLLTLTLTLGPGCPLVGLGGPGMVESVLEDLVVVLEVVVDGLVSIEWSCKDLIPIGILLCLVEGIFLMVVGMLETWRLVLWTACAVGMSMPVPAVSDSICRHDESAMTSSAGEPSDSL